MDISVILPVHNGGWRLDRALASALEQTGTEFEVIVVDDASTDHALEEASGIRDSRVRLVAMPARHGVSAARNAGLRLMTGKYAAFLDADDVMRPGMLAALFHRAEEADADIAICGYSLDVRRDLEEMYVSSDSGGSLNASGPCGVYERHDFPRHISELLDSDLFHPVFNKLYRMDRLSGLAFDELVFTALEDELFNVHAFTLAGRSVVVPDVLYETDLSGDGILSRCYDDNRFFNLRKLWDAYGELLSALGGGGKYRAAYQRQLLLHYLALLSNLEHAGFADPSCLVHGVEEALRYPAFREAAETLDAKTGFLVSAIRLVAEKILPDLSRLSFPSVRKPFNPLIEQACLINALNALDVRATIIHGRNLEKAAAAGESWLVTRASLVGASND